MEFLKKIFGDPNEKALTALRPMLEKIGPLESTYRSLSDAELKGATTVLRERLTKGESLDALLPDAFAVAREAARRTLSQRHYDVQLLGALVLHQGQIAEMRTGEGKTLTATAAVYANALLGKGVHVVTVNDYLACRDAVWMGQIYHALGLSVGIIQHESAFLYDPHYRSGSADEKIEICAVRPKKSAGCAR